MSETVDFLNLLLVMAIECNLRQFRKLGRYYNHYYEKFTEAIKLKCGYDFDYIITYVHYEKNVGNCNYKSVIFVMKTTFLELVACHYVLCQFN